MKIKTSEAEGEALNWMVAKVEGRTTEIVHAEGSWPLYWEGQGNTTYHYSTNWAQGGPIIEREGITVGPYHEKSAQVPNSWSAYLGWDSVELESLYDCDGPTPLIAAMRCYVASKLGEEVVVPKELYEQVSQA